MPRQDWKNLTTPERIDRMRAMQALRSAAMDARGEAVKAFYAQLQPMQQKAFDKASLSMMQQGHCVYQWQGKHAHASRTEG